MCHKINPWKSRWYCHYTSNWKWYYFESILYSIIHPEFGNSWEWSGTSGSCFFASATAQAIFLHPDTQALPQGVLVASRHPTFEPTWYRVPRILLQCIFQLYCNIKYHLSSHISNILHAPSNISFGASWKHWATFSSPSTHHLQVKTRAADTEGLSYWQEPLQDADEVILKQVLRSLSVCAEIIIILHTFLQSGQVCLCFWVIC